MNVLAYDPHPDSAYAAEAGVEYVSLDELIKQRTSSPSTARLLRKPCI